MDRFIGKEIFQPLGITDFCWTLDQAGNPHGMSGLEIRAIDLAKIGQMMLDEGSWNGKPIVSKDWVRQSVEPGQSFNPTCGLLWWLCAARDSRSTTIRGRFKGPGHDGNSIAQLGALKGKPFDREAFWNAIRPIVRATTCSSPSWPS